MPTLPLSPVVLIVTAVALTACGPRECELGGAGEPCEEGLVCDAQDGETNGRCRAPVVIAGQVIDERTDDPIAGAVVVATSDTGVPIGAHAVTNAAGAFEVVVPSRRSEHGEPQSRSVRLHVGAADYLSAPGGLRDAVTVRTPGTDAGTPEEGYQVPVEISLPPLPAELQGGATLTGTVERPPSGGSVLVVAERGGVGDGFGGFSDANGAYSIFNVAPDSYEVRGYAKGANYVPEAVTVSTLTATANLYLASGSVGTVEGTANLLAVTGSSTAATGPTHVALVPLALTLAGPERGIVPYGLEIGSVAGEFSMEDVPNGSYGIWVGAPGEGNSARDLTNLTVEVVDGTPNRAVTLNVVGSVEQREPIDEVTTARPIYSWQPYPPADGYVVQVYDVFGRQARDPQVVVSGSAASVQADADLAPGHYLWRVHAFQGFFSEIARSDPDQGHFEVR